MIYLNKIFIILLLIIAVSCNQQDSGTDSEKPGPTRSEIKKEGDKFQLYVGGEPFFIKGAGLEFGDIPALARNGGNSFRTWRTNNGQRSGKEVLDEAYENGLYVTMGLDVERERHGFDYNNKAAVAVQYEKLKAEVMELKDHPALIIWAIGNELNLRATNPKVWDAVNNLSKMIHEIAPNHLTTTTLAGINKELVDEIKLRASDLDLLSIQMYADIVNLPKYIIETGWDGPYIVTEWGATGHWEVETTEWGAPIENNSTVKAEFYLERYKTAIEPYENQCLGSYVFLWGQKQERTPTWYGIFTENGNETESVDAMHYIWKNEWPDNRCPRLLEFQLAGETAYDNVTLSPNKHYDAIVKIEDSDGDKITYVWEVKPESTDLGDGGDFESTPESLIGLIEGEGDTIDLTAPSVGGAYRLFIYADDGHGNTAHANIPFLVN
jgi:hypothetical protein